MLNRRWQKGEECFKRSIETLRLLKEFKRSTLSLPLVNLGLACWLQGRVSEALATLTQGLRDRQEAFGVNDRISFITGRYLHALGNVTAAMGNQEQSLEYHRKALFHYKHTLGNGHHRTADVFVKVAEHSMRMGQGDNALCVGNPSLLFLLRNANEVSQSFAGPCFEDLQRPGYRRTRCGVCA